jgi:hypothetical protein
MLYFKTNFFVNLKIFLQTLFQKRWLDKEGYIYDLSFLAFKKNINKRELINSINNSLQKYNHLIQKSEYIIYFTYFGTYGSYQKPNKIFIYLDRPAEDIAKTIIHEIVHLKIEDEAVKKHLTHEEKEKIVERIVASMM